MPGEAIVTIRDKQWTVSIADTPWELAQGLGGLPELAPDTGMLFDTGWTQVIQVTTEPMLFPIDIAFLSETMVVTEVYHDIEPGLLVTSTLPARYFLEVNAGELEGIDAGDRAFMELLQPLMIPAETDWMSAMVGFMGFAVMAVFMTAIARGFVEAALAPPKEKPELYGPRGERLLPQTELTTSQKAVILPGYGYHVEYMGNITGEFRRATKEVTVKIVELRYRGRSDDVLIQLEDGRYGIATIQSLRPSTGSSAQPQNLPQTRRRKLSRYDVEIGTWAERDRMGIWLTDKRTDKTIAEWWDEDAREMFEQGFFKPGDIRHQTITGRAFEESVLDYAESVGLIASSDKYQPQTGKGGIAVMPKLPPEARKDFLFFEYIRDLVRLGEKISDEEARLMWEAWEKRHPQRLPAVIPRNGEYSWFILDPETGEILIKTGYASISKAQRAAREFAIRRARYAGKHTVKLRIYDRDPNVGELETGVVFYGEIRLPEGRVVEERLEPQAVIPTEPRRPRPRKEELEFLPDSPEFLAYTIDDIGYREKLDTAFQEAIKRAKGLK